LEVFTTFVDRDFLESEFCGDFMKREGSGTLRITSDRSRFVLDFSFTSIFEPCIRTLEFGLSICIPTVGSELAVDGSGADLLTGE